MNQSKRLMRRMLSTAIVTTGVAMAVAMEQANELVESALEGDTEAKKNIDNLLQAPHLRALPPHKKGVRVSPDKAQHRSNVAVKNRAAAKRARTARKANRT